MHAALSVEACLDSCKCAAQKRDNPRAASVPFNKWVKTISQALSGADVS
jgi:hypothetical protein